MPRLALFGLLLVALAQPAHADDKRTDATESVLLVGNSLSYVNNLPALLAGLGNAQTDGTTYVVDMIGAPGGSLAERWQDGVAARAITSGQWQVLVLQERGGQLACLAQPMHQRDPDCVASLNAHKHFAELAKANGMRVIVLGTWGPDAIWQGQLSRGLRKVASLTGGEALDAGTVVRDYGKAHAQTTMTIDRILHPSVEASLLVAALLYRQVHGQPAQAHAFSITAPLLPPLAAVDPSQLLTRQAAIAGDGRNTDFSRERLQPLMAAAAQ